MSNFQLALPYLLASAGILIAAPAVGVYLLLRYLRRQACARQE